MIVSRLGLRGGILLESVAASHNRSSSVHREADFSNVYERLACLTLL
jgi:exopolyphosphatase/pppGpp-phosphohydrolase